MKIVVVDDEVIIREWLQYSIEQHCEQEFVGAAENGKQALLLIEEERPDIVMTDIKMPVMDGLLLLKEIKQRYPQILVVLLTAFSEFELVWQALREGADEYLLKTEVSKQGIKELCERLQEKVASRYQEDRNYRPSIIRDILKKNQELSKEEINKLAECDVNFREEGIFAIALWKNDICAKKPNLVRSENIFPVTGLELEEGIYYAWKYSSRVTRGTKVGGTDGI